MKIKIEMDPSLTENEVLVRCSRIDASILSLQETLSDLVSRSQALLFFREDTEYYLTLDMILFFETTDQKICAHTADQMFYTHYKLYELEELLPGNFMRISKSTILNTDRIYSITRNLTASSVVSFHDSHKQVFVSRYYYKPLKFKLEEKRKNYET